MAFNSKETRRDYHRRWRAQNPEKVRAAHAKHVAAHPERRAVAVLKHRYGITPTEVAELREAQSSRCAICRCPESEAFKSRLVIDHDHSSGRVRALLCHSCNTALANLKESADTARALAAYLERHRAVAA